jgi:hypothetical protein
VLKKAGGDVTEDFKFHSKAARRLWTSMIVGKVVVCPREQCGKPKFKPWNPASW